ncbi:hypothetical protein [Orenia marismortui]|uniref:Long-subunit fatty acid transport protein n=1 Tax=Orenia marismortui TaxID=46469 RepID=A0A4R8HRU0_9FIRM|nr:hypothetical protein [Orenia marismortui]TDX59317.1 long-subunit fatty acid transport protein [Orenia marismortui]
MKKSSIIVILVLTLLTMNNSLVGATSNRIKVLGGLEGIIADEATDIKLNPAQLYNIEENKMFLDFNLSLSKDEDEDYYNDASDGEEGRHKYKSDRIGILASPTFVYRLSKDNVLSLELGLDSYNSDRSRIWETRDLESGDILSKDKSEDELERDIYSLGLADAIKINKKLVLGVSLGMVYNKEIDKDYDEDYDSDQIYNDIDIDKDKATQKHFDLSSGFIYRLSDDSTLDGSISTWKIEKGDSNDKVKFQDNFSLFIRKVKELNSKSNLVLLGEIKQSKVESAYFGDKNLSQKLAIGQNINYKDTLLAYAFELEHSKDEELGYLEEFEETTSINLKWGVEKEVTDKLTVRIGDSCEMFRNIKSKYHYRDYDSKEFSLPSIKTVNIGLGYKYDELTTIDLSYTPEMNIGEREDDDEDSNGQTERFDMEFGLSVTRKF